MKQKGLSKKLESVKNLNTSQTQKDNTYFLSRPLIESEIECLNSETEKAYKYLEEELEQIPMEKLLNKKGANPK